MAKATAQVLRADPERFPNLRSNPALERALRIQQALAQGRPRDEAVRLAEQAMGPRAPATMRAGSGAAKPAGRKAAGRPTSRRTPLKGKARKH